jgi:hypothetical protein
MKVLVKKIGKFVKNIPVVTCQNVEVKIANKIPIYVLRGKEGGSISIKFRLFI